jgi:hypothetical protein
MKVLPLIAEHLDQSTLRSTTPRLQHFDRQEQCAKASETAEATSQTPLGTYPESLEDPESLSRSAQQDMKIKKLYKDIELLQGRMLVLEQFLTGARSDPGSFLMDRMKHGQSLISDTFEAMIGAGQGARSVATTVEDPRLENVPLKQERKYIVAQVANEVSPNVALHKAVGSPSTAPSLPTKKKKPYSRRKPPTTARNSIITAASGVVAQSTRFASIADPDDSSQIGSLAALKEITAAMAQAPSACRTTLSNDMVHHGFGADHDQKAETGSPSAELTLGNGDDTMRSQPNKRRRTSGKEMSADDAATAVCGKNKAADVTDLASLSNHPEEQQLNIGFPILQGAATRPSIVTQLQDAANTFQIAETDELMIDPALRSTYAPTRQSLAEPGVLSSIENPPDQPRSRQSSQQRSNNGTPQYDSDQERRIREYKARDALRKRKARAASTGKKKMDGEEKFKQEEKIRARDRMVKELMEREEMLENEEDL